MRLIPAARFPRMTLKPRRRSTPTAAAAIPRRPLVAVVRLRLGLRRRRHRQRPRQQPSSWTPRAACTCPGTTTARSISTPTTPTRPATSILTATDRHQRRRLRGQVRGQRHLPMGHRPRRPASPSQLAVQGSNVYVPYSRVAPTPGGYVSRAGRRHRAPSPGRPPSRPTAGRGRRCGQPHGQPVCRRLSPATARHRRHRGPARPRHGQRPVDPDEQRRRQRLAPTARRGRRRQRLCDRLVLLGDNDLRRHVADELFRHLTTRSCGS